LELEYQLQDANLNATDTERVRVLNEQIILQEKKNKLLEQEKEAITDLATAFGQWATGSKEAIRTVIAELIRLVAIKAGYGDNAFLGGLLSGIGSIKGFASGGTFNAGETFVVGEKGPEIITSTAAGTVIPNSQITNSNGFNQNISFSINGSIMASEELDRKFEEFATVVSRSTQNLLRNQIRTGGVLSYVNG
jgi:phage-related minor tail protein